MSTTGDEGKEGEAREEVNAKSAKLSGRRRAGKEVTAKAQGRQV
jgi:hypothetical protein